jgi:patched 1 protein
LSDVLPEHTAPAAFLKARDEYFSFYPMFVVIRGEELDFAQRQNEIEHLRNEIGESNYRVIQKTVKKTHDPFFALFFIFIE